MHRCSFLLLTIFIYLSTVSVHGEVASNGVHLDLPALLSFKAYNPNASALVTWVGLNPCSGSWFGIRCYQGRVAGIFLDSASLVGAVAPLLRLSQIRALAVRNNSLSGALPPLDDSTSPRLRHLLVSRNELSGSLNISLGALVTLRAEQNGFGGGLDALRVPRLRSFNVSGNKLAGEISGDLARFPSSAFGGNPALCGQPLRKCVHAYNALGDSSSTDSNTSSIAAQSPTAAENAISSGSSMKLSVTALMATSIGNALLITVSLSISVATLVYVRRKLRSARTRNASDAALWFEGEEEDKRTTANGGGLVRFEGGEELRLESLLKASAEVLGKGVSGSTYKAVLEDGGGVVVAVKRLSALRFPVGRGSKAFDRHMRLVGRLRHRHVVSLRAYCNSNGERLLVYDYLPNGNLQSVLQGHCGGGTRSLDWAARKSVLFGVAQGLNYIHTFPARPPLVHANVKPSNILLDERGGACVSECGLMRYAANVQQSVAPQCPPELFPDRSSGGSGWPGYAAPELASTRATQESDVYSFGMVLLEVVTGRHKSGVGDGEAHGGDGDDEEEAVGWVKIGMLCTAEAPEERPTMAQVLAMMSEFM